MVSNFSHIFQSHSNSKVFSPKYFTNIIIPLPLIFQKYSQKKDWRLHKRACKHMKEQLEKLANVPEVGEETSPHEYVFRGWCCNELIAKKDGICDLSLDDMLEFKGSHIFGIRESGEPKIVKEDLAPPCSECASALPPGYVSENIRPVCACCNPKS